MPKNLRQAINLHIEQVDAPTVRIIGFHSLQTGK